MSRQTDEGSGDTRAAAMAARQFGVISRQQALGAGVSPDMITHRLETGRWEVMLPSVYGVVGANDSSEQRLMAACLWGGSGAVAIRRSAAAIWGLPGGCWTPPEIASKKQRTAATASLIIRRIATLDSSDITAVGPFPTTTLPRTLIDLSACLSESDLDIALEHAIREQHLSLRGMEARIAALSRHRLPGMTTMMDLIRARDSSGATDSPLETMVRAWLRRFRFPEPIFQYEVVLPDYGPARLDFAYPELSVGVEADSYRWHSGRAAFERDRARISEFASLGWIIIQTTAREIGLYPIRVANRLRRARARRL
jgi:very-short-patch-repair endonuclease